MLEEAFLRGQEFEAKHTDTDGGPSLADFYVGE